MASQDISNTKERSEQIISAPIRPRKIGSKAEKEQDIFEQGMSTAGNSSDLKSNQIEISKTMNILRNTTYWGYGLMTFVIVVSGFFPDIFQVDVWIQVVLVGGVIGNNMARILKQLSESKITDNTGF